MFVADAHCDTLYEIAVENRSAKETCVTRERLLAGGVGLQLFAMWSGPDGPAGDPYALGRRLYDACEYVGIPFVTRLPPEPPTQPTGILTIEGGEMLRGDLAVFSEFADLDVKMIALTWNFENEIGYPASIGPDRGLKPFGFALLDAMGRRGVLADVSHLNEAGFWDVCERSALPVVASHSNLRTLCDVSRNLWPEQASAIAKSGGFIGVNFYSSFLVGDNEARVDDVIRHIDALVSLCGAEAIGFGSDFDGISRWPEGLANPADFPALIEALLRHGYSEAQVRGIAGGNLWRVLKLVA